MKIINIFFLAPLFFCLVSCGEESNIKELPNGKFIDITMVGTWAGSEEGNQEADLSKYWNVERNDDGTFKMEFILDQQGERKQTTESGTWWIKEDKYYELKRGALHPDIYTYEFLSDKKIKFKASSLSINFVNEDYEFIDNKVD
ncbi:MAG: hypothetical protein DWQ02_09465 [Bacteroidetes bacterium]|nr:MAG: hypothetical protein DWQ02_09465 [Bacteroidota bacterium]